MTKNWKSNGISIMKSINILCHPQGLVCRDLNIDHHVLQLYKDRFRDGNVGQLLNNES